MARHYSTKDFFRQMPNALLARYFQARGLFGDLDFAAMKETQPDELFAAWLNLPDRPAQRDGCGVPGHLRAELREGIPSDHRRGGLALGATIRRARTAFVETLAALPTTSSGRWSRSSTISQFWKGATLFYHADTLPYWRKRKNLPHVPAAVDEASLRELAGLIRTYFHQTEGRGQQLRGGALPPRRAGLLLRLPGGLFAAEHRVGGRAVRPPPAQSRLRGDLRLLAEGGIARSELSRLVQGDRAVAGDVRHGDSQAARAAARPEGRARLRPESAAPDGLRFRLRRGQRHSERGGEEAAAVVEGEEGRPHHAGSRCDQQSRCSVRVARPDRQGRYRCTSTTSRRWSLRRRL